MKKIIFIALIVFSFFASCKNQDIDFPDYDYTAVYFPYQSPVRTLILGTDYDYDNSVDTTHQCIIYATMGGVYSNNVDRKLDVVVDNSLCNKLSFESATGGAVLPMPANYYTLPSNQITIPAGSMMGGLKVQLTDAFFADPLAVKNTYVIPLRITKVANADSILCGVPNNVATPNRLISTDWKTLPKDYVLYVVKYKNPWDAVYLRRGIEEGKGNNGNTALDTTVVYHKKYVEYDQVVSSVASQSINQLLISLSGKNKGNNDAPFKLLLTFNNSGNCSITNPASASYLITGSGKYVKNGDMWGNKKRDVLYLKYQVNF